jgi:hypothetical protein
MRAPCPPEDILDLRALQTELQRPDLDTPAKLYQSLPVINPTITVAVEDLGGNVYKVKTQEDYDAFPYFEWYQVFNFVKTLR